MMTGWGAATASPYKAFPFHLNLSVFEVSSWLAGWFQGQAAQVDLKRELV